MQQGMTVCLTFSHPDYTVGSGITPDLSHNRRISYTPLWTRGLNERIKSVERSSHRRSGIAPCPEGLCLLVCHKNARECKRKKMCRKAISGILKKIRHALFFCYNLC